MSQGENRPDHRDLWTLIEYSCAARDLILVTLVLSAPGEETCLCTISSPFQFLCGLGKDAPTPLITLALALPVEILEYLLMKRL